MNRLLPLILILALIGCSNSTAPTTKPTEKQEAALVQRESVPVAQPSAQPDTIVVNVTTPESKAPDNRTHVNPDGSMDVPPGVPVQFRKMDRKGNDLHNVESAKAHGTNVLADGTDYKGTLSDGPGVSLGKYATTQSSGGASSASDTSSADILSTIPQLPSSAKYWIFGLGFLVFATLAGFEIYGGNIFAGVVCSILAASCIVAMFFPWVFLIALVGACGYGLYSVWEKNKAKTTAATATNAAEAAEADAASKGVAATGLAQVVQTHQNSGQPIDMSSLPQPVKTAIQSIESAANLRLDHSQPDPVASSPIASATINQPAAPMPITPSKP